MALQNQKHNIQSGMRRTRISPFVSILLACVCVFSDAGADLFDRGGGLVYDDFLDVTFLQDANLANSQSFGVVGIEAQGGLPLGQMNFTEAQSYIAAMNASAWLGFTGWRLPSVPAPPNSDCFNGMGTGGAGCVLNDLGHITLTDMLMDENLADPFVNRVNWLYWAEGTDDTIWQFAFHTGGILGTSDGTNETFYVWPVHDGDIAAIPVLPAFALFTSALAALGAWRRRG
jgi:hypothetical protein